MSSSKITGNRIKSLRRGRGSGERGRTTFLRQRSRGRRKRGRRGTVTPCRTRTKGGGRCGRGVGKDTEEEVGVSESNTEKALDKGKDEVEERGGGTEEEGTETGRGIGGGEMCEEDT